MAYGMHWEWRGFGSISSRFARSFLLLPDFYDTHQITDHYLWIPGMEVNAKFRKGIESGLKFKRLKQKKGDFEIWLEDEDELYEFPLEKEAWESLGRLLGGVDIRIPAYPDLPPDRETTAQMLQEAGCKIVTMKKQRETRKLEMTEGTVLVEWTAIMEPQSVNSIGLETWSDQDTDMANGQALQLIKQAHATLDLPQESMQPMNYLDAVKQWAEENKI
ncbi:hypothetical protein ACG2F4_08415 [Halalkalibaculum sp. DA3122]|uniref:hypothetical protein n=1 Tax=unclassified Halalkalibaculum TaxID=2964617 RepID=UPI0037545D97